MYKCFYCGAETVGWEKDFTFEDYSLMGEGLVQVYHCNNCDADIEYYIRYDDEEEKESGYDESTTTPESRTRTGTAMEKTGADESGAVVAKKRNNRCGLRQGT